MEWQNNEHILTTSSLAEAAADDEDTVILKLPEKVSKSAKKAAAKMIVADDVDDEAGALVEDIQVRAKHVPPNFQGCSMEGHSSFWRGVKKLCIYPIWT